MAHIGSWGLPDLGITEALQNIFNPQAAYSAEGGSNLFGPVNAPTATSGTLTDTQTVPTSTNNLTSPSPTNYTNPTPPPQQVPQQTTSGSYSFNMSDFPNYAGWDPTAAQQDWKAKGSPSPGVLNGGSGGSYEDLLQAQKNQADQYYNQISSGLDRLSGLYDQNKGDWEQQIADLFGSQSQSIGTNQESALNKLDIQKEGVNQDQTKTLSDLSQNMRNMIKAGQMKLGAYGAGNSTAAPMYAYAMAKQSNKNMADVKYQANKLTNDINLKVQDVKSTFSEQMSQLTQWKTGALTQVGQWYTSQMGDLESRRDIALQNKVQMQNSVLQQALGLLSSLDEKATSWQSSMQQWATDRLSQLNNYKIEIANKVGGDPGAIVGQELQAGLNVSGNSGDYSASNPYALQKKKLESSLSSLI